MWINASNWIARLGNSAGGIGAIAALALLVPGGSLMLLLLWALRHRPWFATWESLARRRAPLGE
jgi:hypothetical protein